MPLNDAGATTLNFKLPAAGKKGNNPVQVQARPDGYVAGVWLQDSILVVHD